MSAAASIPAPAGDDVRRRNRRVGVLLAVVFVGLVLLCAAYIFWYGGTNKPPMKPFHSGRTELVPTRTA